MPRFVLDSWALLAFFLAEPAAIRVRGILESGPRGEHELYLSVVNLGEVMYNLDRRRGIVVARNALRAIEQYVIRTVDVNRLLALEAATLKVTRRLGYADCFAAALALRLEAAVLTGDRDFQRVEDLVTVEWLQ